MKEPRYYYSHDTVWDGGINVKGRPKRPVKFYTGRELRSIIYPTAFFMWWAGYVCAKVGVGAAIWRFIIAW